MIDQMSLCYKHIRYHSNDLRKLQTYVNQEVHEVHARFVSSRIDDLQKRVDLKGNSVSGVTTLCRKIKQKDTK